MKKPLFCSVILASISGACASDGAHEAANDDASTQVAFYGLTVMDCQHEASQCIQAGGGGFLTTTLDCSAKLSECLAKAGGETAKGAVDATQEVTTCGTDGVSCVSGADGLRAVLACEDQVQGCVVEKVDALTSLPLPTRDVFADLTEDIAEVVETSADVAHEVVDTTKETVEDAVDTTHEVAVQVVDTSTDLVEHAVDTTSEVAHDVADTAGEVADDAVDTTTKVAKTALQCGEESRDCIHNTHKLLSCQLAYAECLSDAL